MPVLATSGLDDDIKIWVPSCENEPDLTALRKVCLKLLGYFKYIFYEILTPFEIFPPLFLLSYIHMVIISWFRTTFRN